MNVLTVESREFPSSLLRVLHLVVLVHFEPRVLHPLASVILKQGPELLGTPQ